MFHFLFISLIQMQLNFRDDTWLLKIFLSLTDIYSFQVISSQVNCKSLQTALNCSPFQTRNMPGQPVKGVLCDLHQSEGD